MNIGIATSPAHHSKIAVTGRGAPTQFTREFSWRIVVAQTPADNVSPVQAIIVVVAGTGAFLPDAGDLVVSYCWQPNRALNG